MLRVVIDANVLVAALLSTRGAPAEIVRRWLAGWFDVVVSPLLLAEVERAFTYPKLSELVTSREARAFVAALARHAVVVDDPTEVEPAVPDDPRDDYLVALGRAAGADVLVSGDRRLLSLVTPEPPIVSPRVLRLGDA